VIDETENVKTICLTGRQAFLFNYAPGQYITLQVIINDQAVQRSYSIASSPSRPHSIEITVKRITGDLVSNWLCDHIKVGDTLKVKGPSGRFSCFNYPARKLLFLAAGSGIVPIMSMLRWIVDTHAKVDVQLILSCKTPADIIYREELEFIAARYENITLQLTFTGTPRNFHDWPGHTGRINAKLLSETITELSERQVFLCGPEQFMHSAAEILIKQGAAKMNIHRESFITKTTPLVNRKSVATIKKKQGKYRVQFTKSGLSVRSDEKTNLLDLAAAHNIRIDSDCRTGNCGECMVRCLWGKIEMSEEAEIDPQDKQSGWIYSCCAYPKSDVVLDV
jgi:ferredoxin-NADP reductase